MTVDEFYNYITKHMTPEEALRKLLSGSLMTYESLKLSKEDMHHPELIIAMAAFDNGWDLAIKRGEDDTIKGMIVGPEEYIKELVK